MVSLIQWKKSATDPGYFDDPVRHIADREKELYANAMAGHAPSQFSIGVHAINYQSINCQKNFIAGNDFLTKAAKQNFQPVVTVVTHPNYIKAKADNNRFCKLKLVE